MEVKPIGYINSLFTFKNGTPRQPSICPFARGTLQVDKSIFTNPEHSLEGIEEFSHVWLIFIFHKNNAQYVKAKVKPPRLNGKRVGLFSTRSPYRPNAIGLTLAKLESVAGNTLHLSGIDLLDGTPVLDIKPYIPDYDSPTTQTLPKPSTISQEEDEFQESESSVRKIKDHELSSQPLSEEIDTDKTPTNTKEGTELFEQSICCEDISEEHNVADDTACESQKSKAESSSMCLQRAEIKSAKWISEAPISKLSVLITDRAKSQLQKFSKTSKNPDFKLKFLNSGEEALDAIRSILSEDPRSIYRRQKCGDSLYYFTVDVLHVTCWFDHDLAEIVRIQPVLYAEHLNSS